MNAKQIKITLMTIDEKGNKIRRDIKLDKIIFNLINKREEMESFVNTLGNKIIALENEIKEIKKSVI